METARTILESQTLSDNDVDLLYDITEITDKILTEERIDYILSGGSLLGSSRCGGLLYHDNDVDFDVLESDLSKIRNLDKLFLKHDLVLIETPGWGLQVSYKTSPNLHSNFWSDGVTSWASKWPFLDLIGIKKETQDMMSEYVLAGDVARQEYPNYFLTVDDWENPKTRVKFGHLQLLSIGNPQSRLAYLNRNYPGWTYKIEIQMDHRSNKYFNPPIIVPLIQSDFKCRERSKLS